MRVAHRENDLLLSRPAVEAALFGLSFGGDRLPAQLIVACADDDDALIIDHDVGTMGPRLPQNRWRNDVSVDVDTRRSDEHTSELQSLLRVSYAVLCLK